MKFLLITLALVAAVTASPVVPKDHKSPLWTRSGKFEGDIALTDEQQLGMKRGRNGLSSSFYRWSNRTIPYKLKEGDFNEQQAAKIRSALEQYNQLTCLTVREAREDEKNYILVTREDTGCWSYVGDIFFMRPQQLNLQDNRYGTCLIPGTIVHEFMHAAGFHHQQSAPERDEYIVIQWENIESGLEDQFEKYGTNTVTNFGVEYDYLSVMHYDRYAFSKNGQPTMLPINDPNQVLGNDEGFTEKDILKLNRMYGCE